MEMIFPDKEIHHFPINFTFFCTFQPFEVTNFCTFFHMTVTLYDFFPSYSFSSYFFLIRLISQCVCRIYKEYMMSVLCENIFFILKNPCLNKKHAIYFTTFVFGCKFLI